MTVIGVLLILAAIAIFIKPHIENYLQQRHDQQQITQYEKKHTHILASGTERTPAACDLSLGIVTFD